MRTSRKRIVSSLAIVACLAAGVPVQPALAQTQEVAAEELLARALDAQSKAQAALDTANEAVELAKAMMAAESPVEKRASTQPPVTSAVAEPICVIDGDALRRIVDDPNSFHQRCLGLTEFSDFDTVDLNLQAQGSSDGGTIAVLPSYTWRWGPRINPLENAGGFGTRYFKVIGGIRAPIDPGQKTASFADLTEPEIVSGVQGVLGAEIGGTVGRRSLSHYTEGVRKALLKARADCVASRIGEVVGDPLSPSLLSSSRDEAVRSCEGAGLSEWMAADADRRKVYYRTIVQPIWNVSDGLRYYVGVQGTYAKPEYEFFPLSDPAMTGFPTITDLPAEFPKGASTLSEETYSLKGYGGLVLDDFASIGLAASYRRDFAFPSGSADQTLCNETAASFTLCYDKNIAPPYELEGFVLGGRLGFDIPRQGFLPPFAIELKPSYALDVEQFGIQGSLFFLANAEGKQKGGVVVGCTDEVTTRHGFALKGDCKASLFFGTTFSLDGRP